MNIGTGFKIDLSEIFPHLEHAPIVEAVVHWRARSENTLEAEQLQTQLKNQLPDYPTVRSQQEVQLEAQIGPDGTAQSQRTNWHGFRLESKDGRYIAQFTRNGFVFSRLTPYEDWDRFTDEAKRLWKLHVELTGPSEIERLGVRFINRIVPVELDKLDKVLALPPRPPGELPLPINEFLHRSQYDIPGYAYGINVIQTTQPPAPPEDSPAIIVDIDVFTTTTMALDDAVIDERLKEMRWLKNKAFYALLADEMITRFKEAQS